jgi:hypothetical protein
MEQSLGGHLKTGHWWPLQNRPTKLSQNKSIYNPPMAVSANLFSQSVPKSYTSRTWTEDTATRGRDQSADPGPEWRAAQAASPRSHSGGKRKIPGAMGTCVREDLMDLLIERNQLG